MLLLRFDASGSPEALIGPTVGVLFRVTLRYTIHQVDDVVAQPSP
jgi:hypothetical protein